MSEVSETTAASRYRAMVEYLRVSDRLPPDAMIARDLPLGKNFCAVRPPRSRNSFKAMDRKTGILQFRDGQRIGYRMRTSQPWLLNTIPSRLSTAPEGLNGGGDGAHGVFRINGEDVVDTRKREMAPEDEVFMITPGGGGYGTP